MKIIHDIKSISAKRREQLRKEAYEAFQSGITGHSFARTHKIYPETVYSWYRKFKVHGEDAVKEQKRGPDQNTGSLLNARQMKKIRENSHRLHTGSAEISLCAVVIESVAGIH